MVDGVSCQNSIPRHSPRRHAARDLMLLATLLEPLGVHAGILGFLRGVAAGRMAGD